MKQGLLFKDAPEPRVELFCTFWNEKNGKSIKCNTQFYNAYEYSIHLSIEHEVDIKFELPTRPLRRWNCTEEEARNLDNKKCWCGKERKDFEKYQVTYCCKAHNDEWWIKTDYVNTHKSKFLKTTKECAYCGLEAKHSWNSSNMEMDHIIAIVLGGHPWHHDNLQALCSECHKIKTKSDVGILAWWKRQAKYDTGPIIPNPQLTLDEVINYDDAIQYYEQVQKEESNIWIELCEIKKSRYCT